MITVGMNYHVIPGKQKDFEDKFAAVMGALNAAAGHTSSTLWKDVADDDVVRGGVGHGLLREFVGNLLAGGPRGVKSRMAN